MNRKWLFVLPNLFTVSSIFCGIYSITLSTGAQGATAPQDFYRAAIAILFGMFFDGCDGRVARLTKTQSEFGVQLDSLADVISFGAAPALLLYKWALSPLGFWGVLIAGVYASCGALRLARFNVSSSKETGPGNYFTGLPIPLAAGMVVAVVVAATRSPEPHLVAPVPAAVLTLVLSYLMVSTIKYHSFKKVHFDARTLAIVAGVVAFGAVVALQVRPSFVLVAYFSAYVLLGLVEEIVFRRRRAERLAIASSSSAAVVGTSGSEDDDEDAES
jgi:CDP-diacylglycerol--serine O-phosphatidyltransferase